VTESPDAFRATVPPLGAAGEVLLARAISAQLGQAVRVGDCPLLATPLVMGAGAEGAWLADALRIAGDVSRLDGVSVSVGGPMRPARRTAATDRAVLAALRASRAARDARLGLTAHPAWSIQVVRGACASGDSRTAPAGARPASP
jgi:hypothetical protein